MKRPTCFYLMEDVCKYCTTKNCNECGRDLKGCEQLD